MFPRLVDFGSDGDDDGGGGDDLFCHERVCLAGEPLLFCSGGNGDPSVDDGVFFDDCLFPRPGDFDFDGDVGDDGDVAPFVLRLEGYPPLALAMVLSVNFANNIIKRYNGG